ncbi:NIPSNAP family protein [Bradyrhizobium sp. 83002]|uniref:NIPSNAP family protein n=1 Tax=Bradyrhizobium aeschynomenes TaxID=2734909 RepID=UPI0015565FD3|nr:NIPSNAP family protein [Bradyrhizobium aeschynomenes]NPU12780.1 NIPSNAP family protein [Bradyrhizobium aeschynomenes]
MQRHAIFELRRYRMRPGGRDTLIDLFDTAFVEPQEALGMRIEGEFRDCDDPNAFVWVRSFADMDARAQALQSFYGGNVWAAHRAAANATMLNSDNVLLLKPAGAEPPFARNLRRAEEGNRSLPASGIVVVSTCSLAPGKETALAGFFSEHARPILREAGARIEAMLISEHSPNSFPRLPVREGETVFVWLECHQDEASLLRCRERLSRNSDWTDHVQPSIDAQCWRPIEVSYLTPSSRSLCAW